MTESWVGGDIGGIRAMGDAYKNAKHDLESIVKPLGEVVEKLAKDAAWQGDAADSFRAKWTTDALTAGGFAELVHATGEILTTLADHLSAAESALQNAEDVAVKAGVPMQAKGVPGQLVTGEPKGDKEQKAADALRDYGTVRDEILHTAQQARLDAADALQKLYAEDTAKVSPGDKITIADALRALYAYDSERTRVKGHDAADKLDAAKKEAEDAKKDLKVERKDWQKQGKTLPNDSPAKLAYKDALTKLDGLEADIARAEHGSSAVPYDHALNVKIADAADALRLGKGLDKLPEFLREIPIVDVAAAGACGILEAKDDHDKGWSWTHSVAVDGAANVGGLVLGAGGAALLTAEAPVGLTIAVGVGAVIVTTDVLDEAFHEHWGEDIHDHGVVGGILHGSANVAKDTVKDVERLGGDIKGGAKKVWHGVTSFF